MGVDNKILSDVESGRKDRRLQFNELIELIAAGGVEKVIATRCDQISRSIITLKKFFEHCEKHGVMVLVLDDAIDTTTAAGKFHLNMLGALAVRWPPKTGQGRKL